MLIDTEMPGSSGRLTACWNGKGLHAKFQLVVLTHGHVDHVGNAEAFEKALRRKNTPWQRRCALLETADLTFPGAHNFFTKILRRILMAAESRFFV